MQTPEQIATAFDEVADRHDTMRWDLQLSEFDAAVLSALEQVAASRVDSSALFLGGGSGREAFPFAMNDWICDLVDLSPRMLVLARTRLHEWKVTTFEVEALQYLTISSANYDFISMVGELLGYVEDPALLLYHASLRLKADGLILATWVDSSPFTDARQTDKPGIVELDEREGLSIRAWRSETMQALVTAARLEVVSDVCRLANSPRRSWLLRKES